MAIVFDEVVAEMAPPTPTTGTAETSREPARPPAVDPQSLARELQRLAERAERLQAD